MNSKQIECFLCVADCLNISNAAQKLYASQSTVSRQISLLEEELGIRLFVRGNNYLRLTPAGVAMLQTFQEMEHFFRQRFSEALLLNEGKEGTLRMGFYCNMQVESFLGQMIYKFQETYPGIVLDFGCAPNGSLDSFIRSDFFDVVFLHDFDEMNDTEFLCERMCYTDQFLVYGANHPLAQKADVSFVDFKDETFWRIKDRCGISYVRNQEKIFRYYGIEEWKTAELANIDSALLNIRLGKGVMFLDAMTWDINEMYYRILKLPEEISKVGINVAWHKNNLNPAISLFVNQFMTNED